MRNRRNYYKRMHVQPDAPAEIIRSSYRTLMLKLGQHPDLGGEDWNAALINEAYETLSDPVRRARYDRELLDFHNVRAEEEPEPDSGPHRGMQNRSVGYPVYHPIIRAYCVFCHTPLHKNIPLEVDMDCFYCRSPLNPGGEIGAGGEQGRAVQRRFVRGPLSFYTDWPQQGRQGEIRDLSPLGLKIGTEVMFHEGQVLKLESDLLSATARVVHSYKVHRGGIRVYLSGLKFLTLRLKHLNGNFISVLA